MHILPPVRPEESIQRLTALLTPIAEKMVVVPRKRMTWTHKNQPQLFLFLDGELSILRASDGLLIVTVYHPHLFGIAEMIQPVRGTISCVRKPNRQYCALMRKKRWKPFASTAFGKTSPHCCRTTRLIFSIATRSSYSSEPTPLSAIICRKWASYPKRPGCGSLSWIISRNVRTYHAAVY